MQREGWMSGPEAEELMRRSWGEFINKKDLGQASDILADAHLLLTTLRPPDRVKWNYQLHRAYAVEDLVANLDENEGSPLVDPQWNLIVLDHSRAFTNTLAQPYEIGKRLNEIDRLFFDRIKALDEATVKRAIGDLVDAAVLDALFARRDNIVKTFETLAARKGENAVFTP
jgi:hypothetical protein